MVVFRPLLRNVALLSALAMLCMTLAPAMGQWLRSAQGGTAWQEICSSTGIQWRAVSAEVAGQGVDDPVTPSGPMGEHCPWCAHFGDGWPAMTAQFGLALATSTTQPERFYSALYPLFAWAGAQPRGPPGLA